MAENRGQFGGTGEPLAYQSRRVASPRPWAISEILCWTLILVLTLALAVETAVAQRQQVGHAGPNMQLTAAGKYAVGIWELEQQLGQAKPAMATQLLESLAAQAKTPADHLRVAIVYGEMDGPGEAQAHLPNPGDDAAISQDVHTAAAVYISKSDKTQPLPSAQDLARFRERYGWFADLALAQGRPKTDPLRQQVLGQAYATLFIIAGGVMVVLLGALAGLVLLIMGSVRLAHGKMRLAFAAMQRAESPPADRRSYLQGFAWYLSCIIVAGFVLRFLAIHTDRFQLLAEIIVLPVAFAIGAIWPFLMGQGLAQWRQALGLQTGRGIFREIGGGIMGYLAGLPLLGVALLVTVILMRFSGVTPTHPIERELRGSPGTIAFAFFLASVWAPVTEEMMFRGALFASLRERFGWWISAPVMAVIFAAVHPQGWVALPILATVGVTLAGIREWRGSIIGCMTAHCLHNTGALIMFLLIMR